jgi:PhnB protein
MKQKLTPYFTVCNADKFINFAICVFEAKLLKDDRNSNDRVQHARLLIEDNVLMLDEAFEIYKPNISQVHLNVNDIEKTYNLAIKNGPTSLMKPMLRPHGRRMTGFGDTCGNIWWIAETVI